MPIMADTNPPNEHFYSSLLEGAVDAVLTSIIQIKVRYSEYTLTVQQEMSHHIMTSLFGSIMDATFPGR